MQGQPPFYHDFSEENVLLFINVSGHPVYGRWASPSTEEQAGPNPSQGFEAEPSGWNPTNQPYTRRLTNVIQMLINTQIRDFGVLNSIPGELPYGPSNPQHGAQVPPFVQPVSSELARELRSSPAFDIGQMQSYPPPTFEDSTSFHETSPPFQETRFMVCPGETRSY